MAVLLVFSGLAVLLWKRYYRGDTHNTAQRVLKNSTVPFVVRLIIRVLEFGFALVLYSSLAGEEIGPYTLAALLVAQYLGTFTEFGLGVLLTRDVAKDPSPAAASRLFGMTLSLRAIFVVAAIPIAGGIIAAYGMLAEFGIGEAITPVGQTVIWILLLTLIPSSYSGAVTALYNAAEEMEVPAIIELITATVSVLIRVTLLLLGFGIVGLAWTAVGVSTLTAAIYLVLQTRRFFPPRLYWDWPLIRSFVPMAFPLMLNNLLNVVFFRFDTFIVKAFGEGNGDLLVQQYAVPYQFINIALVLPPVITFAVFPMLARRAEGDRTLLATAQNRTLQLMLWLAFPVAMGMSLLAPNLIALITRSNAADYLPISAHVLAILAWFLPLSFVNGLLQYVLIAINQQWVITRAFLIGAVFNLTANLLFIPWFGLYAASIITILSEVVLLAVFLPVLRSETLTPPLAALAWRPAVATAAMGGAMIAIYAVGGWMAAVVIAPPVYVAVLWAVGAIGVEERALVRKLLSKDV